MSEYKTATDWVDEFARDIDATDDVVASAHILANQFGGVDPEYERLDHNPSSVGVACLYVACTMHEVGISRLDVADRTGKASTVISKVSTHIADELAAAEPMREPT